MTSIAAEGMGGFKDIRHVSSATLDSRSYGRALLAAAREDDRIVCLGADLSQPTQTDLFRDEIPSRFFMMGIQEAHMVGAAGGMARVGDIPVCHSFCVFMTRRVYDQVAMQVAYPKLPVKLVGFLPGLATELGPSHQAIDDVALMRALPNMVVLEPRGPEQVGAAVAAMLSHDGPVYLRLMTSRSQKDDNSPLVPLTIGKGQVVRSGRDIALIAAGIMVRKAEETADLLASWGLSATVVNMASLKPIDSEMIRDIAKTHRAILTVENHSRVGGLGSAVAEVLAEAGLPIKFRIAAINDMFSEGASLTYLLEKHDLTAPALCAAAIGLLEETPSKTIG
jgi:transketolase